MYVGEELVESVYRNIECFVQMYVGEELVESVYRNIECFVQIMLVKS